MFIKQYVCIKYIYCFVIIDYINVVEQNYKNIIPNNNKKKLSMQSNLS